MAVALKNPKGVAPPVAFYRHLAVIEAPSRVLVMAGQLGQSLDGAFPESVEAQFEQALANIITLVASEGGDAGSIARLSCFSH